MSMLRRQLAYLFYTMLPSALITKVKKLYYPQLIASSRLKKDIDINLVERIVDDEDFVIDIGANIGVYTYFLSKLTGSAGCVYSIEPIPTTYDILSSNIHKLGLTNVVVHNFALSNRNALVQMEIPELSHSGMNYYRAEVIDDSDSKSLKSNVFAVEARRLDDVFSDLEKPISFIKCDVEGHEMACIEGAISTIEKYKPAWLIEIDGNIGEQIQKPRSPVFNYLRELGYRAFWYDGLTLQQASVDSESLNYWFLQPAHVNKLLEQGVLINEIT